MLSSRFDVMRFPWNMHARSCRRVASRQSSIFSLRGRHVVVVSPRIELRGTGDARKVKNREVSRTKLVRSQILLPSRYRFDPGICIVLYAKERAQVPGPTSRNRRQFPRSAFGNTKALTLPSIRPSSPLPKVKGFPFVFLRFCPFLSFRFRLSAFLYTRT